MGIQPGQLSVVIPVYNNAGDLKYCLSSIEEAREGRPIEVIVVDDASTDTTPQVIEGFDVKCFRNDSNVGQAKTRNRGALEAGGEYLLFIDSDVVVPKDCFKRIEDYFDMDKKEGLIGMQGIFSLEHPFDGWYSLCFNTFFYYLTKHKSKYTTKVIAAFFLVKKEEFDWLGGYCDDIRFLEDEEFGRRMAAQGRYLALGPVQIIHRKRATGKWFYHNFIFGGKMLVAIGRKNMSKGRAEILPAEVRNVSPMRIWFLQGVFLIAVFLLPLFIPGLFHWLYYAALGIVVAGVFFMNFKVLWKVKPNLLFFIFCSFHLMIMPWLVLIGVGLAIFLDRSDRGGRFLHHWNQSRV